jgi:2-polyprenyl-6-methoxyphenol hydroxylase-like FAD-dependent oxidoreductase
MTRHRRSRRPQALSEQPVAGHHCERLFADHLGGHGLLENNSKWLRFRSLRCAAWHDEQVALVGDAGHTAHFSVGSGTKMAMEDAVALADAVAAADDVPAALARYEQGRRPAVERIQAAARPSIVWWERFRRLADRSDEQFAFHFLTRSPVVSRDRLKRRDRRFVRRVERWHAGATGGPPRRPRLRGRPGPVARGPPPAGDRPGSG